MVDVQLAGRILCIFLVCTGLAACRSTEGEGDALGSARYNISAGSFVVYDASLYREKPDLSRFGIEPLTVVYASWLWRKQEDRDRLPSFERLRKIFSGDYVIGPLVCIDVEDWPLRGDEDVKKISLTNYKALVQMVRKVRPDLKLGYYGVPPIRDYKAAQGRVKSKKFQEWQEENRSLTELAYQVDVVFPSLYTFDSDRIRHPTLHHSHS